MDEFFARALLTVVQILFESLPVSSSGHVYLTHQLLHFFSNVPYSLPGLAVLDDGAHGVSAFLVALFFFKRWILYLRLLWQYVRKKRSALFLKPVFTLCLQTFLACGVTSVFYGARSCGGYFSKIARNNYYEMIGVCIGFLLTACCLLVLTLYEYYSTTYKKNVLYAQPKFTPMYAGFIMGLVQGGALFLPGFSRFASTYVTARFLGYLPRRAFAFSWAIQFPLCLAVAVRGGYKMMSIPIVYYFLSPVWLGFFVLSAFCAYWLLYFSYRRAIMLQWWCFAAYLIIPIAISFWMIARMS